MNFDGAFYETDDVEHKFNNEEIIAAVSQNRYEEDYPR